MIVYLILITLNPSGPSFKTLNAFQDVPSCQIMREQLSDKPGQRLCLIVPKDQIPPERES